MNNKQEFKILSLSGGGYRGLYTATVLHELEKKLKERILKIVWQIILT